MDDFLLKFKRVLSTYLLIWLALACAVSCLWQDLFSEVANPFILTSNGMKCLIAVTMLAVGSLLPAEEVKAVAKRWPKTVGGTCVQYLSMPTLAFIVAKLFHLEGPYFIGIMMAGCVPGAMASNVLTLTARGNVSYSVGLTTSATLFSPLVVPATLWIFFRGANIEMDFASVMTDLLMTVVAPVALGFACSQRWKWWSATSARFAEIVANFAIIWIIAGVLGKNIDSMASMSPKIVVAMLTLNFGGYLAGYLGGTALRLTPEMRRALVIEVGMQNAGLGATLCSIYFAEVKEASLFCASYAFACMATGIVLAQTFRLLTARAERKRASVAAASAQDESSRD